MRVPARTSCLLAWSLLLAAMPPGAAAQQPGAVVLIAGTGGQGYAGDGGPATRAQLLQPTALALGRAGDILVADWGNSVIRRIDARGIITTVAGTRNADFTGDGGPAARAALFGPNGVTVDAAGNVLIADTGNQRIRRVDSHGVITTIAGTSAAGYAGDGGPATKASLNQPTGIVVDPAGNIIFSDRGTNVVRKIDPKGIITTIAGNNTVGYAGDNGPATKAQINDPWGLALGPNDDLFIADLLNNVIRRVAPNGTITTVAGNNHNGHKGDGGPATQAELNGPTDVAVDGAGQLFISDWGNQVIRKVDTRGIISTLPFKCPLALTENPAALVVGPTGDLFVADAYQNQVCEIPHAGLGRPGDVNADGRITVADAELALRAAVGSVVLPTAQQAAADLNGDGKITVADVILILRKAVGL